ncbi:hypothetical protein GW17_00007435 [Ensete ventricosum]|nr:hypothetical protein GW17_00007435 [Ensete ventricosum]
MIINPNEGSRCVVNRSEDMTAVDFDNDVNLVEKEVIVLSTVQLRASWQISKRLIERDRTLQKAAEAAGQQQEGAVGRARCSELYEPEVTSAWGRTGWSEIRSSDSKHTLLYFRSQFPTEVDAEVRKDLSLGKRLHRSRAATARGSHNRWKSLSVDGVGACRYTPEMKRAQL